MLHSSTMAPIEMLSNGLNEPQLLEHLHMVIEFVTAANDHQISKVFDRQTMGCDGRLATKHECIQ